MNMNLRRAALFMVVIAGCRQAAGIDDLQFATGEGGSSPTSSSSVASGAGGSDVPAASASSSVSATVAASASSSSSGAGGEGGAGGAGGAGGMGAGGMGVGGGGGDTIGCGNGIACPFGDENLCCWNPSTKQGKCQENDNQCSFSNVSIECQSSGQCANGFVCCVQIGQLGMYKEARCQAGCANSNAVLCDTPGLGDPSCPLQSACVPDPKLPDGYFVCEDN